MSEIYYLMYKKGIKENENKSMETTLFLNYVMQLGRGLGGAHKSRGEDGVRSLKFPNIAFHNDPINCATLLNELSFFHFYFRLISRTRHFGNCSLLPHLFTLNLVIIFTVFGYFLHFGFNFHYFSAMFTFNLVIIFSFFGPFFTFWVQFSLF